MLWEIYYYGGKDGDLRLDLWVFIVGYSIASAISWLWVSYCNETKRDSAILNAIIIILTLPLLLIVGFVVFILSIIAVLFKRR